MAARLGCQKDFPRQRPETEKRRGKGGISGKRIKRKEQKKLFFLGRGDSKRSDHRPLINGETAPAETKTTGMMKKEKGKDRGRTGG